VRLAALSEVISWVDLEGSKLDPGILRFPCFHLNSRVSHFLHNVTSCVNYVEFVFRCAVEFMTHYSWNRSCFLRQFIHGISGIKENLELYVSIKVHVTEFGALRNLDIMLTYASDLG